MRFLIERQNWTFELTCSSRKSNLSTSGTHRAGARIPTLPFFAATTLPGGSELRLNWYPPDSRGPELDSPPVPNDHYRPSRARSFRRKIGRLLLSFSRTQPPNHSDCEQSMSEGTYIQELPGHMAELPASGQEWELDGRPSFDTAPGTMPGNAQRQGLYTPASSQNNYHHRSLPGHSSANVRSLIWEPHLSTKLLRRGYDLAQAPCQSTSTLVSPDVSPIERQSCYSNQPHETNGIMSSVAQPTVTTAWTSGCPPMTTSPNSPAHHYNKVDTGYQYTAWIGRVGDRQSSIPTPTASLTHPLSPPHGAKQADKSVDRNAHSVSPIWSRHSSLTRGYADPAMAFPTPSEDSLSPCDPSRHSFEAAQESLDYTSSQSLPKSATPGPSGMTRHAATASDNISQRIQYFQQPSLWERPSNGFDEPLPSYSLENPHSAPIAAQNGPHPPGQASPARITSKKAGRDSGRDTCIKPFPPLPCSYCTTQFNGQYRKGNLKRHVRSFHTHECGGDEDKRCRVCGKEYKRADARRKHEWKKHRLEEARPEKRRKEKRIYMPGMPEYDQSVIA